MRKSAKKQFQQAERIQEAVEHQNNLATIHQSDENEKCLFYSIIRKQRQTTNTNTKQLMVNNTSLPKTHLSQLNTSHKRDLIEPAKILLTAECSTLSIEK